MIRFLPGNQSIDNIPKTTQRIINLLHFLKILANNPSLIRFLAASQINQTQFSLIFHTLNINSQNSMTS